MKALIISPLNLRFVNILSSLKVSDDYVTNLEEAEEKLEKNTYDLIILQTEISPRRIAKLSEKVSSESFYNTIKKDYSRKTILITELPECHENYCCPYGVLCYNIAGTLHYAEEAIRKIVG